VVLLAQRFLDSLVISKLACKAQKLMHEPLELGTFFISLLFFYQFEERLTEQLLTLLTLEEDGELDEALHQLASAGGGEVMGLHILNDLLLHTCSNELGRRGIIGAMGIFEFRDDVVRHLEIEQR